MVSDACVTCAYVVSFLRACVGKTACVGYGQVEEVGTGTTACVCPRTRMKVATASFTFWKR